MEVIWANRRTGFPLTHIDSNRDKNDRYFMVVGSGTEYGKISQWFEDNKPENAQLLSALPKMDYDELVESCDGSLFLILALRFPITLHAYCLTWNIKCLY